MTSAFEELGGRRETAAEALARWNALQNPPKTEQQIAEEIAESRDRVRRHDAYFADEFMSAGEQHQISLELARKLGHFANHQDEIPE